MNDGFFYVQWIKEKKNNSEGREIKAYKQIVCGWGRVAATNVQTHLRPGFGNFTRSIEAGGGSFSLSYSLQVDDCIVRYFC